MGKLSFEDVRNNGLLIYEFIRGSHCHGIATETSDVDYGGVYIAPPEQLLGLGLDYQEEISDEKGDTVWYELNKFMHLLLKSNPTVIEALFVDDKYVVYEHPIMTEIKKYRDSFITKECFNPFFGYSRSQIIKAKGLNKKINWEEVKRKGILDFCYTYYKQGSSLIKNWLEYRGMDQKYCGLVNIPNMENMYGCYYDWGNFIEEKSISCGDLHEALDNVGKLNSLDIVRDLKNAKDEDKDAIEAKLKSSCLANLAKFIVDFYGLMADSYDALETKENLTTWYWKQKPIGYRGMTNDDETSTQLRLSSVEKGESPICYVSYNENSFQSHCRKYKEYKEWEANRNPVRYQSNLNKSYDAKNMCECMRLMNMCVEIAKGEPIKVDRTGIDREFLLSIKRHEFEYEELMAIVEKKEKEMKEAIETSTLPDEVDRRLVDKLLTDIRMNQLRNSNTIFDR